MENKTQFGNPGFSDSLKAAAWGTCGGSGFYGPTLCVDDYLCVGINEWFSQCFPAAHGATNKTCISSGRANSDIAGIGVVIALGIQGILSLCLIVGSGRVKSEPGLTIIRRIVFTVLLVTIDVQTITGISLLGSALANWRNLDLYHFHIIYDTISLTAASLMPALYRASIASPSVRPPPPFAHRFCAILLFCVLYLTLSFTFGKRLNSWNANKPGNCFEGRVFIRPDDSTRGWHPFALWFSTFMILFPLLLSIGLSGACIRGSDNKPSRRRWLCAFLSWSVIQMTIHVAYFATLRNTDQHFLVPGESENEWGFGQILALFSFLTLFFECFKELQAQDH